MIKHIKPQARRPWESRLQLIATVEGWLDRVRQEVSSVIYVLVTELHCNVRVCCTTRICGLQIAALCDVDSDLQMARPNQVTYVDRAWVGWIIDTTDESNHAFQSAGSVER